MKAIVALGLGALAMYLLDPHQGRQRRARLRNQMTHAKRVARERVQGQLARAGSNERPNEWPHDRLETPQGAQQLGR